VRDDVRTLIGVHIHDHGQHLVGVAPASGDPIDFLPFIYTIGNHGAGLPELLLIGGSGDVHGRILNVLGKIQRERGSGFQHAELVDFTARLPARIADAGQRGRDEYAVQASVYYKTDKFEVRQVLLPDPNGRYPGDPGCQPPFSKQPVLSSTH
jgi:hypothetical protein